MVRVRPSEVPGVYTDGRDLYTRNLVPGRAVYGERLARDGDAEYRSWDPRRSKLSALLHKGWTILPVDRGSEVLYLGAATGTTVSHLSDLCTEGTVYAVEFSRRVFEKLILLAEARPNVIPILADAMDPDSYRGTVGRVDFLYQDIAQRDQVGILRRNLGSLKPEGFGILIVKAKSTDVARDPRELYREAEAEMTKGGLHVLGTIPLSPFEKDHAAIPFEFGSA